MVLTEQERLDNIRRSKREYSRRRTIQARLYAELLQLLKQKGLTINQLVEYLHSLPDHH